MTEENDVISLKQIILVVQNYFLEVVRNWKLIAVFMAIGAAYFGIRNFLEEDIYKANMSFMLEGGDSSNYGGFGGLLGSFGFDSEQSINRDKLIELAQSERIIKGALVEKVVQNDTLDYLGNHIIDQYEMDENWNKKETHLLHKFRFEHDSLDNFGMRENYAVKRLKSKINGNPKKGRLGLLSSSYSEKSGILYLKAQTTNPELSVNLINEMYAKLDSFFVFKAIEKQKQNLEILQFKTDSLANALKNAEFELALIKDTERKLFRRVDKVKEQQLENQIRIGYLALGKALENREIADYSLRYQRPLLSVIDTPSLPIMSSKKGLLLSILLGLIFGGTLGAAFVVIRKKYLEIMSN